MHKFSYNVHFSRNISLRHATTPSGKICAKSHYLTDFLFGIIHFQGSLGILMNVVNVTKDVHLVEVILVSNLQVNSRPRNQQQDQGGMAAS